MVYWYVVLEKYFIFICVSIGVWTFQCVDGYHLHHHIDKGTIEDRNSKYILRRADLYVGKTDVSTAKSFVMARLEGWKVLYSDKAKYKHDHFFKKHKFDPMVRMKDPETSTIRLKPRYGDANFHYYNMTEESRQYIDELPKDLQYILLQRVHESMDDDKQLKLYDTIKALRMKAEDVKEVVKAVISVRASVARDSKKLEDRRELLICYKILNSEMRLKRALSELEDQRKKTGDDSLMMSAMERILGKIPPINRAFFKEMTQVRGNAAAGQNKNNGSQPNEKKETKINNAMSLNDVKQITEDILQKYPELGQGQDLAKKFDNEVEKLVYAEDMDMKDKSDLQLNFELLLDEYDEDTSDEQKNTICDENRKAICDLPDPLQIVILWRLGVRLRVDNQDPNEERKTLSKHIQSVDIKKVIEEVKRKYENIWKSTEKVPSFVRDYVNHFATDKLVLTRTEKGKKIYPCKIHDNESLVRAFMAPRTVLLLVLPVLAPVSIYAQEGVSAPIFLRTEGAEDFFCMLWASYQHAIVKALEDEMKDHYGISDEDWENITNSVDEGRKQISAIQRKQLWGVLLQAFKIQWKSSRIMQLMENFFSLAFVLGILYSDVKFWLFLSLVVLFPILFIHLLDWYVVIGKKFNINDHDLKWFIALFEIFFLWRWPIYHTYLSLDLDGLKGTDSVNPMSMSSTSFNNCDDGQEGLELGAATGGVGGAEISPGHGNESEGWDLFNIKSMSQSQFDMSESTERFSEASSTSIKQHKDAGKDNDNNNDQIENEGSNSV